MKMLRVFKISISLADGSKMTFDTVTKFESANNFCVHDGIESLNLYLHDINSNLNLSFEMPGNAEFAHFGMVECRPLKSDFIELIEWLATKTLEYPEY